VPHSSDPSKPRLPLVIYVLAGGTFLMGTTEFVIAGLLPELASAFGTTVGQAGLAITVFAVGMIVGAPTMALATLRLPRRVTLTAALVVFAIGHVVAALTDTFAVLLIARVVTAVATGAFWGVGSAAAAVAAGPASRSKALGLVLGGGMLANVLGVPLGSLIGQWIGWRGTFWALAVLAVLAAVGMARLVPADHGGNSHATFRGELRALRSARLWLVLATCAAINAGVLSVYGYIAPLITDRAGLPAEVIPFALMAFGVGALVGNIVGGHLGDSRPFATSFVTATITLLAAAGIWAGSGTPAILLALFAILGLVGLSANPIMIALAIRFGGDDSVLASAMPTSIFNLGTAIGTGLTSVLLDTGVGPVAPAVIGVVFAVIVFIPLGLTAWLDRRAAAGSANVGGHAMTSHPTS
jgi:predicted MFS family arabinose efflux permease